MVLTICLSRIGYREYSESSPQWIVLSPVTSSVHFWWSWYWASHRIHCVHRSHYLYWQHVVTVVTSAAELGLRRHIGQRPAAERHVLHTAAPKWRMPWEVVSRHVLIYKAATPVARLPAPSVLNGVVNNGPALASPSFRRFADVRARRLSLPCTSRLRFLPTRDMRRSAPNSRSMTLADDSSKRFVHLRTYIRPPLLWPLRNRTRFERPGPPTKPSFLFIAPDSCLRSLIMN